MKNSIRTGLYYLLCIGVLSSCHSAYPSDYKGKPYFDVMYHAGAHHDSDTTNSGSGKLNPADGSYLNDFRIKEAVDISYTKFRDPPLYNLKRISCMLAGPPPANGLNTL